MPFCLGKYMMTTTDFYSPHTLTNVTIPNQITGYDSIDWNFDPSTLSPDAVATSKKSLYTISGFWMEKFLSNTSQLWCTGYNIPNKGPVQGIELRLAIARAARIEDLLIQLTLNGDLIGDNLASNINPVQSDVNTSDFTTPLNPVGDMHIYGAEDNMWGTTGLTAADIADPTFGVVISFKSNIIYPHRDIVYLSQASIRITYA